MLDASGIIHVEGDRFLVAEDEIDILRFFDFDQARLSFSAAGSIDFGHEESDFESLAYDSGSARYFCIGSHGEDYSKRLLSFELEGSKARNVIELDFDASQLIDADVDIEALTVWRSRLLIGYRRPSRNGLALAAIFDYNSGVQLLSAFNLGGRTFRDMVCIDDINFLILAGPQRGKDYDRLPPRVYWWNGDIYSPQTLQCKVDLNGFRAEGIAVRKRDDASIDILIGSDESKTRNATCFRMLYLNVSDVPGLLQGVNKPLELEVEL